MDDQKHPGGGREREEEKIKWKPGQREGGRGTAETGGSPRLERAQRSTGLGPARRCGCREFRMGKWESPWADGATSRKSETRPLKLVAIRRERVRCHWPAPKACLRWGTDGAFGGNLAVVKPEDLRRQPKRARLEPLDRALQGRSGPLGGRVARAALQLETRHGFRCCVGLMRAIALCLRLFATHVGFLPSPF